MKLLATAVAALLVSTAFSHAASFDFGLDAENFQEAEGFEGTFAQVYQGNGGAAEDGGISVTAASYDFYVGEVSEVGTPFMDAYTSKPAGLGVCSNGFDESIENGFGGESTCSTQYSGDMDKDTSDDNLMFSEVLGLTFSTDVFLTSLLVRDAGHNKITDEEAIWINGDIYSAVNGFVQGLEGLAMASLFYFTSPFSCQVTELTALTDNGGQCQSKGEIYLSTMEVSAVPLPAAGWLLIAGLGGLAAMRRKSA